MSTNMGNFWAFILESSIFVLMILGIRRLFLGKIRNSFIHVIWIVVFLRFMFPVNFISIPFSVGNVFSGITDNVAEKITDHVGVSEKAKVGEGQDILQKTDLQQKTTLQAISDQAAWKTAEKRSQGIEEKKQMADVPEDKHGIGGFHVLRWGMAGVVFLWLLSSNLFLMWKLKRSRTFLRQEKEVPVYVSPVVVTPCLYGFIHPVIYLPQTLFEDENGKCIDPEQMRLIIMHEYVHFKHRDHLLAFLRMVLMAAYWFDPFLWMAVSYSRKDAELFCDETVIQVLGEEKRFCYGSVLIRLAGRKHPGDFRYSMLTMSRKGREMERRIRAISKKKSYSGWMALLLVVLVILSVVLTCSTGMVSFAGIRNDAAKEKEPGKSVEKAVKGASAIEEDTMAYQEKQLKIYDKFLRVGSADPSLAYYALLITDETDITLVTAKNVSEISGGLMGSSECRYYHISEDKVLPDMEWKGKSGELLRFSDGKLWVGDTEGIFQIWFDRGRKKVFSKEIKKHLNGPEGTDHEYHLKLLQYEQASGVVFYQNPYVDRKIAGERNKVNQKPLSDYLIDLYAVKKVSSLYTDALKENFETYISYFTEAVNTGDVSKLDHVLDKNSKVYSQQCQLAKNYYKRGIREKVKSYEISSLEFLSNDTGVVRSKEVIRVSYADNTKRMIRQTYAYTCKYTEKGWMIIDMEDIS